MAMKTALLFRMEDGKNVEFQVSMGFAQGRKYYVSVKETSTEWVVTEYDGVKDYGGDWNIYWTIYQYLVDAGIKVDVLTKEWVDVIRAISKNI